MRRVGGCVPCAASPVARGVVGWWSGEARPGVKSRLAAGARTGRSAGRATRAAQCEQCARDVVGSSHRSRGGASSRGRDEQTLMKWTPSRVAGLR